MWSFFNLSNYRKPTFYNASFSAFFRTDCNVFLKWICVNSEIVIDILAKVRSLCEVVKVANLATLNSGLLVLNFSSPLYHFADGPFHI